MEITGTKAAFIKMISERGVYKKLGVSIAEVSNWKRYFATGAREGAITIDKMENLLLKYGATVVHEKIWEI